MSSDLINAIKTLETSRQNTITHELIITPPTNWIISTSCFEIMVTEDQANMINELLMRLGEFNTFLPIPSVEGLFFFNIQKIDGTKVIELPKTVSYQTIENLDYNVLIELKKNSIKWVYQADSTPVDSTPAFSLCKQGGVEKALDYLAHFLLAYKNGEFFEGIDNKKKPAYIPISDIYSVQLVTKEANSMFLRVLNDNKATVLESLFDEDFQESDV